MDAARRYTDKQLKKLEKRIAREYKQAQKEIMQKWRDYMSYAQKQIAAHEELYRQAVRVGTTEEVKAAAKELQEAKKAATLNNRSYQQALDSVTARMADANATALSYINGNVPDLYMVNHNAIAPTAKSLGIDFTIVNEHTLKNVTMAKKLPLPKKLNVAKDMRWNAKKMNSALLQGIIQGESMPKIANRMLPIIKTNRAAAIRSARTMVTQAENKGRLDSYFELQDEGAVVKKRWIATMDDRTRAWHLDMDGQEVDLDENFVDGNGNELEYPGDPSAEPETVYNCRCSMELVVIGFKDKDGHTNYVDRSLHG